MAMKLVVSRISRLQTDKDSRFFGRLAQTQVRKGNAGSLEEKLLWP